MWPTVLLYYKNKKTFFYVVKMTGKTQKNRECVSKPLINEKSQNNNQKF